MLASCVGFDIRGRERQKNIDAFDSNEIIKHVHVDDITEEVDNVFYSSSKADDQFFNLVYFYKSDGDVIIQTAGTVYIMDDNGKTFDIIKNKK